MGIGIVDIQIAGLVDAGRDQHRIMLAANGVEADILADIAVQHEFDAAILQQSVAALDDLLLQLEAGNAIDHQPAGTVVAVIDGDLKPHPPQPVRRREATRPGTDNANGFRAFLGRLDGFDPAFFPGGIGDVFFDRADSDGAVARLLDDAIAFAEPVLRADAATDLGEGIGFLTAQIGLARAPLGGQAQPVGDIVVQRAMVLAIGHATLAAAAGLFLRLGIREFTVDLVEILTAHIRRALLGHLTPDGDKFQHFLRGHVASPPCSDPPLYLKESEIKTRMLTYYAFS